MPVPCELVVTVCLFLRGAGGCQGVLFVVLVFHDGRQKASAQPLGVCLEIGVTEAVGKALLLCGVDGVELSDALLALALYHALCLDAATVIKVPLMARTIA